MVERRRHRSPATRSVTDMPDEVLDAKASTKEVVTLAQAKENMAKRAVWLKANGHRPVSHEQLDTITDQIADAIIAVNVFAQSINAKNIERNEKIAALETKVAELETRTAVDYVGIWLEKYSYRKGQIVTHKGTIWFCRVDYTMEKPGTSTDWQLMVKNQERPNR
ncbi:MAG: hypothetical protein ABJA98_22115 [Acidobacteriota bacterium]